MSLGAPTDSFDDLMKMVFIGYSHISLAPQRRGRIPCIIIKDGSARKMANAVARLINHDDHAENGLDSQTAIELNMIPLSSSSFIIITVINGSSSALSAGR